MSDMSTVLCTAEFPGFFMEALRRRYEVLQGSPGTLPEGVERVQAMVTFGMIPFDRQVAERMPRLGLVSCFGSGYERIDLRVARERGIQVTSNVGTNAAAVADLALGLLLACVRRIGEGDRFVREHQWTGMASTRGLMSPGLTGRRLGVLGLGAIGRQIARRAAAFDMEVAYHNRSPRSDVPYTYQESPLALAKWADFLVVSLRADDSNRGLVGREELEALGPQGYLVNIARGSVVDEPVLVEALTRGTIAGAGLDVFASEPQVPEALMKLPNVVLTPHLGGTTEDARQSMARGVLDTLAAYFAGRPLPNAVSGP